MRKVEHRDFFMLTRLMKLLWNHVETSAPPGAPPGAPLKWDTVEAIDARISAKLGEVIGRHPEKIVPTSYSYRKLAVAMLRAMAEELEP